jgi:hypothetical protein
LNRFPCSFVEQLKTKGFRQRIGPGRAIAQPEERTEGVVVRKTLLTLAAMAAAPCVAIAAPPGLAAAESAVVTIGQLEAQGFDVKIDRVGSAPLSECVLTSVRNPQNHTELVRVNRRGDDVDFIPVIVRRTITVSLNCSR